MVTSHAHQKGQLTIKWPLGGVTLLGTDLTDEHCLDAKLQIHKVKGPRPLTCDHTHTTQVCQRCHELLCDCCGDRLIGLHWQCAHWAEIPIIPVTPPQYGPIGPEAMRPPRDISTPNPGTTSERVSEVQADGQAGRACHERTPILGRLHFWATRLQGNRIIPARSIYDE